jgi:hypothetical protein
VRDSLPTICVGPVKNLKRFAEGKIDFDDAYHNAMDAGGGTVDHLVSFEGSSCHMHVRHRGTFVNHFELVIPERLVMVEGIDGDIHLPNPLFAVDELVRAAAAMRPRRLLGARKRILAQHLLKRG